MKYPAGVVIPKYVEDNSISNTVASGTQHVNTFDVKAKHKVIFLEDHANVGVRFNVETAPAPLAQHKRKSVFSREMYFDYLNSEQYNKKGAPFFQAVSFHESDRKLVAIGGNGFLTTCLTAFAKYLPLGSSPDHIWTLINYTFAKHVDKHAEEQYNKKAPQLLEAASFHASSCRR